MDFNHLQQTKNPKYGICKCVQMLDDMEYILEYPIDPQHFDKRIISIQVNYKVRSLSWIETLKMKPQKQGLGFHYVGWSPCP